MFKLLLFGLIVYFGARGLLRLVRSLTTPQDDSERKQASGNDRIDPRNIKDATFRDIEE